MKKTIFMPALLITLFFHLTAFAQGEKIPLDHSVYDDWNNIQRQQLSPNGKWASYEVNPQVGDGWLYLMNLETMEIDSFARGGNAAFSTNTDIFVYLIRPERAALEAARKEGRSRSEMPASNLGILLPGEDDSHIIEGVSSFLIAGTTAPWVIYQMVQEEEENGAQLIAYNPVEEVSHQFDHVSNHQVSENQAVLAFFTEQKREDQPYATVNILDLNTQQKKVVFEGEGKPNRLATGKDGSQLAFLFTGNEENPLTGLYLWQQSWPAAGLVVGGDHPGLQNGWSPSEHATPVFSDNGNSVFFGTAPKLPETPANDNQTHQVDIWHYQDPLIQPMQLAQLQQEKRRTYTAVYHIEEDSMIQLADEEMPYITTNQFGRGNMEIGQSFHPYLVQNSFESGDYRDVFLVDTQTGERQLVLEKHRGSVHRSRTGDPRLSPEGNYLLFYCQASRNWKAMSLPELNVVNLTEGIPYPIFDELHDAPSDPDPYGIAGWIEDDRYVLIYDRYDIWQADPEGKEAPVSVTNDFGRENDIRFRFANLDTERTHIGRREDILLSAFHLYNKQSGFYHARANRSRDPQRLVMDNFRYFPPTKASNANVLLWRKSSFQLFPDLWVSDLDFQQPVRISHANPQQSSYRWGEVQLVDWVSFANDTLQGLLYTPENMDPDKKHPMIVFFYERSSDGLHTHQVPSPSRSTINRSYSVSNGYIVFMTDIPYTIGYPGQSAYDAIVSGTKAMTQQFDFIDRENIGIQGQSWAGYQIAWLITRTDMFKAAMAGAPVSNMISAYGGIRWATGMSRIYQYEQTQSRIGGTIWDETLKYIENSPVFFANRVNTPLLMMHNDDDGAVPWYQGIEYFMALRRLGKPVWMLNYNDEAHNLTRRPNMMDLSVRMYQFFDHYLKGEPAPRWMKEGVPAIMKGIDDGYELTK